MYKGNSPVKIVLTGGGTAGHVLPHLAMLDHFHTCGWEILYIGSQGIEKQLTRDAGISFRTIQTGKLRRYWSWQNFFDIFRVCIGVLQSFGILFVESPKLVFSKGGFVSVPVALAAWLLRIPVITHESDFSPGIANKLIGKFAKKVLYSFPGTAKFLSGKDQLYVGLPVRSWLINGVSDNALSYCNFTKEDNRPVILIMGGSLGAERINQCVVNASVQLFHKYRVIHITGKGKSTKIRNSGYCEFEYVDKMLSHFFALASLVVSRAGANSLFELLSLRKPSLLIPLEIGSRGDQLENARAFESQGWAAILREQDLTVNSFIKSIDKSYEDRQKTIDIIKLNANYDSSSRIMDVLKNFV